MGGGTARRRGLLGRRFATLLIITIVVLVICFARSRSESHETGSFGSERVCQVNELDGCSVGLGRVV